MKRHFLTAAALLLTPLTAHAQTPFTMPPPAGVTVVGVQVVTTCGNALLTNNSIAFLAMNTSGQLCTNATGSGTTTVVGNQSNANSAVATSATNLGSISYNYGFNGTTWDQLQVDASKNLKTAAQATENHTGEVGGNLIPITNDMTTSNATVTTGQSIGGIQTLANAVRVSGALGASGTSGYIQSITVTFADAIGSGPLDVYFYNATVTTGSNCQNATTFVLQNGDRDKVLGIAHVTDFTASNTAVVAQASNLAIPFGLASSTSLFACVVARGSFAITGTANASIKANVVRN